MNDSILLLFSKLLCGHNHVPTRENIDTEICRHDRHKKRFYFQKKKKNLKGRYLRKLKRKINDPSVDTSI